MMAKTDHLMHYTYTAIGVPKIHTGFKKLEILIIILINLYVWRNIDRLYVQTSQKLDFYLHEK